MGKVRYKNIPESYRRIASPSERSASRKSLGFEDDIGELYNLDIEDIIPYKKQARKVFDDKELKLLASTIKRYGITTPIVVIKSSIDNKYEVISGERRLRAARIAEIKRIPCLIRDSKVNSEEVALIENIQRKDLHPVELSMGYKSLLSNEKYGDRSKLAEILGVSPSHISETLKLADLPEEIKNHLLTTGKKSRVILRKLSKANTKEEMDFILGLNTKAPIKKNIASLYQNGHEYKFSLNIHSLSKEARQKIISELESAIKYLRSKEHL